MRIIRISKDQLSEGIRVEKEHKDIYDHLKKLLGDDMPWTLDQFSENIAKAHLEEFDDYYTRLKKMEEEAKKEMK